MLPSRSRERFVCRLHANFRTLKRFGAVCSIKTHLFTLKFLYACNCISRGGIPRGGSRCALQLALQRLGAVYNALNLCLPHARHREE
jgi:hypothetical protein